MNDVQNPTNGVDTLFMGFFGLKENKPPHITQNSRRRQLIKMPREKMDTIIFAPCGMNCKVCYMHCYHKKTCAGCLNSDKGKTEH